MNMSRITAGAYLWHIRESRKLSRIKVAALIRDATGEGTNDIQVMRIEKGQPTDAAVLAAFVKAVAANGQHVIDLITDDSTSADVARSMAEEWLRQNEQQGTPAEQDKKRTQAIQLIDELLADPKKLDRLLGYGDRLRDEL